MSIFQLAKVIDYRCSLSEFDLSVFFKLKYKLLHNYVKMKNVNVELAWSFFNAVIRDKERS